MPSSAAVYGDLAVLPLTEDLSGMPSSFYGLTKLTAEGYLRIYHEAFGLNTGQFFMTATNQNNHIKVSNLKTKYISQT